MAPSSPPPARSPRSPPRAPLAAATTTTTAPAPATRRLSSNVPLTLLYKALDGAASGIWASGATSAYILLLFAGTSASATVAIGAAQALQGVALAACALPLAWAADKLGRARVARFAGALALLASALTSAAVLWPAWQEEQQGQGAGRNAPPPPPPDASDTRSFRLLCGALAMWGAASGVGPTVDALFADSLPTGGRASWFQLSYALALASRSLGPLVAALVFWHSGDQWQLPTLRRVIVAGQIAAVLPAVALFFLNDGAALGEESEGMLVLSEPASRLPSTLGGGGGGGGAAVVAGAGASSGSALTEPLLVVVEEEEDGREANGDDDTPPTTVVARPPAPAKPPCRNRRRRRFLRQRHVPIILAATDLITGLASGMTVKFFSVWFIDQVGLPPTSVNLMMAMAPLLIAVASAAATRAARTFGRVQTMLAFKTPGIALLFWLALDQAMWKQPWTVALVFLSRTAVMNACYPLSRSVLSDYVAKARRARWNALEAVTAMSWSGSAAAGGWLIQTRGYGAAFLATAVLQAVALLGQLLLLPLVPRREGGVLAVAARRAAAVAR
jgi:MFS family permease